MLDDIIKITQEVFSKFIKSHKPLSSPKKVYDSYRALSEVITNVQLVKEHYLALDFTEDFLQNSSYGEAVDKWRVVLNEDLESLNRSVKHYLLEINQLAFKDEQGMFGSFVSKLYNSKTFYGFVRDQYNVGFIEPCSTQLISNTLINNFDENSYHIEEFNRVDLSSYEKRVSLQKELQDKNILLIVELEKVQKYIVERYTIKDLV